MGNIPIPQPRCPLYLTLTHFSRLGKDISSSGGLPDSHLPHLGWAQSPQHPEFPPSSPYPIAWSLLGHLSTPHPRLGAPEGRNSTSTFIAQSPRAQSQGYSSEQNSKTPCPGAADTLVDVKHGQLAGETSEELRQSWEGPGRSSRTSRVTLGGIRRRSVRDPLDTADR